jgi:hypothetical protein
MFVARQSRAAGCFESAGGLTDAYHKDKGEPP